MAPIWLVKLVKRALAEDLGSGDLTTNAVISSDSICKARIIARSPGRIFGTQAAKLAFALLNDECKCTFVPDGTDVEQKSLVAKINGPTKAVLSGERVALNFLQHLSGIATATKEAVLEAEPYGTKITDTRKTTPGLRFLEKEAVKAGGGINHRFGLYDAILLKENHLKAAGSIKKAVEMCKKHIGHMVKIEVEVEDIKQVKEAVEASCDAIMLDNMSLDEMKQAVEIIGKKAIIEASGNIRVEEVAEVAACGVDVISIGWITHSTPSLDMSLLIEID